MQIRGNISKFKIKYQSLFIINGGGVLIVVLNYSCSHYTVLKYVPPIEALWEFTQCLLLFPAKVVLQLKYTVALPQVHTMNSISLCLIRYITDDACVVMIQDWVPWHPLVLLVVGQTLYPALWLPGD